jgi:hypothetical protein
MANPLATHPAPNFQMHSRFLATVRALCVVILCAALTAGFLAQVWRAPERATSDLDARAGAAQAHRAS